MESNDISKISLIRACTKLSHSQKYIYIDIHARIYTNIYFWSIYFSRQLHNEYAFCGNSCSFYMLQYLASPSSLAPFSMPLVSLATLCLWQLIILGTPPFPFMLSNPPNFSYGPSTQLQHPTAVQVPSYKMPLHVPIQDTFPIICGHNRSFPLPFHTSFLTNKSTTATSFNSNPL